MLRVCHPHQAKATEDLTLHSSRLTQQQLVCLALKVAKYEIELFVTVHVAERHRSSVSVPPRQVERIRKSPLWRLPISTLLFGG